MTAYEQLLVIVSFIGCGVIVACSLETFRHLFRHYRRNVFFVYIREVLFWLLQSLFVFYLLWRLNEGVFRLYFLLAILCGLQIYQVCLKRIYQRMMQFGIRVTYQIVNIIYMIFRACVILPIHAVISLLIIVLLRILSIIYGVIKWILRLLPKKVYKNISQMGVKCSTMLNKYLERWKNRKGGGNNGTF